MCYRDFAEEFCSIRALNAKRASELEKSISAKGEASVLLYLAQSESKILAGEIAKGLYLSASRCTNILNSLERKGMIQRQNDQGDRRKVYILLTEAGKEFIMQKQEEVILRFEKVFQKFGEKDSREYLRLLKKFSKLMEEEHMPI